MIKNLCNLVTVGQPASLFLSARRDALSEAEDQLLFCAVFSLYCLISSEWHTQSLRNDQLETSYMVEGGQPCVTGSNPVMEEGSSSNLNNGSLPSRSASSEGNRRLFNISTLKTNQLLQTVGQSYCF